MKTFSTIIFILWTYTSFATGQIGELVIYKGDTLTMLGEPLETYLRNNEPRENLYPTLRDGCSTALWRGYVGLWEIKNNRLLLVDIFACGDKLRSIKNQIFPGQDSEIFIEWFNGQLFIEKGEVIKYNHMAYDRYYEYEVVLTIKNGIVESEEEFRNGVKPDDKRFSRNLNDIIEEIYKGINWSNLPKISKDKKLFVQITFDKENIVSNDSLIDSQNIEDIYKGEVKRTINKLPEVQIFYSRGKPLNESYYGALFFNRENRKKYAR